MRNNRVLMRDLHVAHDTKCFLPCVYLYLHRQLSDYFILSQKCQRLGCIENGASLRLNHNFIQFDMF